MGAHVSLFRFFCWTLAKTIWNLPGHILFIIRSFKSTNLLVYLGRFMCLDAARHFFVTLQRRNIINSDRLCLFMRVDQKWAI